MPIYAYPNLFHFTLPYERYCILTILYIYKGPHSYTNMMLEKCYIGGPIYLKDIANCLHLKRNLRSQ